MDKKPVVTKMVRIEGRVQGVWYRGWTIDQATARGLSGWVRNRRDGSVEAVFHGPEAMVVEMVNLCWTGPPVAHVTNVMEQAVVLDVVNGFVQLATE